MSLNSLRLGLLFLLLDPRVHQLVKKVGKKRVEDAIELDLRKNGTINSYEPPWNFPSNDPRFSLQAKSFYGLWGMLGKIKSPEWMLVITARQIALDEDSLRFGFVAIEYRLTDSNALSSQVPERCDRLNYLWWRLDRYFQINRVQESSLVTDDLLQFTLDSARLMWGT